MSAPAPPRSTHVPALIPLSLLEAIRNLDTPVEDGLSELAVEVVRAAFRPQHINFITLVRQAAKPRASYVLAAEYVLAED